MKIKICKRCNGTGWGTWRQESGRCYGCEGTGVVKTFTAQEKRDFFVRACEKTMMSLPSQAGERKAQIEALYESRNARAAEKGRRPRWTPEKIEEIVNTDREIESLRETWRLMDRYILEVEATGRIPREALTGKPSPLTTWDKYEAQEGRKIERPRGLGNLTKNNSSDS